MTAAYNLGGTMIRPCSLNIRSVKAVPTPTVATVTTAGGALLGATDGDSTMTEVMTPPAATGPGDPDQCRCIIGRTYSVSVKGTTTLNY